MFVAITHSQWASSGCAERRARRREEHGLWGEGGSWPSFVLSVVVMWRAERIWISEKILGDALSDSWESQHFKPPFKPTPVLRDWLWGPLELGEDVVRSEVKSWLPWVKNEGSWELGEVNLSWFPDSLVRGKDGAHTQVQRSRFPPLMLDEPDSWISPLPPATFSLPNWLPCYGLLETSSTFLTPVFHFY